MWKLISYSEIKLPLQPYNSEYVIAIIENDSGERLITRIGEDYVKNISIGVKGEVKKHIGPQGEIDLFIPFIQDDGRKEQDVVKRKIEKIGIIGTGTMGCQLTKLVLKHGFHIVLKSRSRESLQSAFKKIENDLLAGMTSEEKDRLINNIKLTTEFNDLSDRDIIIECVIEDEKSKENIFRELDKVSSKEAILATNTSSLSINDLASAISNPTRLIGIHFFNPVEKMKLIEVVRGKNTSKETIDIITDFIKEVDKIPVVVDDSPGFVVNRLLFSMINEAGYLLKETNASIEQIDTAMKLGANHPMGPFELADFIGIDVVYEIIKTLSLSIPNFKPPAETFEEMIKAGKLGRKTKEGFYKYRI